MSPGLGLIGIATALKLASDFVLPLSRLDAEGRYPGLFMELRLMRQEGNWFDVNGAFFFQKHLENRASKLRDNMRARKSINENYQIPPAQYKATHNYWHVA